MIIGLIIIIALSLRSRGNVTVTTPTPSPSVTESPQITLTPSPIPDITPTPTPTPTEEGFSDISNYPSTGISSENFIIEITSNGFNPQIITIKLNEGVIWNNKDTQSHQIESDVYESNVLYPALNTVGIIEPGEIKTLIFAEKGTYTYHDANNPANKGTIIVE